MPGMHGKDGDSAVLALLRDLNMASVVVMRSRITPQHANANVVARGLLEQDRDALAPGDAADRLAEEGGDRDDLDLG